MARSKTVLQRAKAVGGGKAVVPEAEPRPQLGRTWTPDEVRVHEQEIEGMMLLQTRNAMVRVMRQRHGLRPARTYLLIQRVQRRWLEEDQDARPAYRASMIRRLSNMLVRLTNQLQGERAPLNELEQEAAARGVPLPVRWLVPPNPHAAHSIIRVESLLADIQGTRAPQQVEINLNARVVQSIQGVIANLTAEQIQERLERARQRQVLAGERAAQLGVGGPNPGFGPRRRDRVQAVSWWKAERERRLSPDPPRAPIAHVVHFSCGCRMAVSGEGQAGNWESCQDPHLDLPRTAQTFLAKVENDIRARQRAQQDLESARDPGHRVSLLDGLQRAELQVVVSITDRHPLSERGECADARCRGAAERVERARIRAGQAPRSRARVDE